jgi:hypothetical protein
MNFIFKSILDNCRLFKIHHQVIKETMLAAIESNDEEALESVAVPQTPGVESIVKQEILMVLNATACRGGNTVAAPLTRSKEHLFHETSSKWRKLRTKRLGDEQHLQRSFVSDAKRSKSELKCVMKSATSGA